MIFFLHQAFTYISSSFSCRDKASFLLPAVHKYCLSWIISHCFPPSSPSKISVPLARNLFYSSKSLSFLPSAVPVASWPLAVFRAFSHHSLASLNISQFYCLTSISASSTLGTLWEGNFTIKYLALHKLQNPFLNNEISWTEADKPCIKTRYNWPCFQQEVGRDDFLMTCSTWIFLKRDLYNKDYQRLWNRDMSVAEMLLGHTKTKGEAKSSCQLDTYSSFDVLSYQPTGKNSKSLQFSQNKRYLFKVVEISEQVKNLESELDYKFPVSFFHSSDTSHFR